VSGLDFAPPLRALLTARLNRREPRLLARPDLRAAAVGIVLLPAPDGQAGFVITRRPATLRHHRGQWALPGGRLDAGESAADAVRRETVEEIGLALPASAILARLDDYATRSGHLISPFVLWSDRPAETPLHPSPDEVAAIYRVALADLAAADAVAHAPLLHLVLPTLPSEVHAPTAAVLYQFREIGLFDRDVDVADVEQPEFAWE
jgi:8-oxo-dGTP pyrophosphatase MutT (NUDIX family)